MAFYGAGATRICSSGRHQPQCSPTWHYSVGCKPPEVVPYQGQHGPVISP